MMSHGVALYCIMYWASAAGHTALPQSESEMWVLVLVSAPQSGISYRRWTESIEWERALDSLSCGPKFGSTVVRCTKPKAFKTLSKRLECAAG